MKFIARYDSQQSLSWFAGWQMLISRVVSWVSAHVFIQRHGRTNTKREQGSTGSTTVACRRTGGKGRGITIFAVNSNISSPMSKYSSASSQSIIYFVG